MGKSAEKARYFVKCCALLYRCVLLTLCNTGWASYAASLQVTPTLIEFPANTTRASLDLRNFSPLSILTQVRVFRWTQENGEDKLTPDTSLIASPPQLLLGAQETQLVRLIVNPAQLPNWGKSLYAFRLIIDEIPSETGSSRNVKLALRYSLPVFLLPLKHDAAAQSLAKALQWRTLKQGDEDWLEVNNTGTHYAQLADAVIINKAGKELPLYGGLMGYVLPQQTAKWRLPNSAVSEIERLSIQLNGQTVAFPLATSP